MAWNTKRASQILEEAQHRLAAGTGTSDRTLMRISAVSDPTSAMTKAGFMEALQKAGWSKRRVREAVAIVQYNRLSASMNWVLNLPVVPFVMGLLAVGAIPYIGATAALVLALWYFWDYFDDDEG